MDSQFVTALIQAVNGVKKLEECAGIIVSAAIDDLLLRIAQDYNLDFSKLVSEYKDDIVEAHTILATGKQMCKGRTAKNNPCSRQAVSGGYCRGHMDQGITKAELDKRGASYASSLAAKKEQQPLAVSLKRLDISTPDPKVFKVSKSEVSDFF